MRKEDFFTGEVLQTSTSPPFSQDNFISEQEAIQNASFGKYDYDPGARMMSQPVNLYPGGYGYGSNPQQNSAFSMGNPAFGFMNPPIDPNTGYYYNPYAQAYQEQLKQISAQQVQYFVQPVNFGGEFLPNLDYNDEIEKLKMEAWQKEQDMVAQNSVNNPYSGSYFGGINYYGQPYFSPFNFYQMNGLNNEISQRINELKEEARENRLALSMRLSKLAHNYLGEQYNEDDLRERYTGKTIITDTPMSGMTYGDIIEMNRFNNLVPFDNSQMYRDASEAVSKQYHQFIPEDADMKECFDNMGVVYRVYELEEEKHRRRNKGSLYNANDNSYKYFVRAKAAERYAAQKNGGSLINSVNNASPQNMSQMFPTLAQSAKLTDDGTLNVVCNFGSKAGQVYSVHNSQESEYDQQREAFINSISQSIYLDSPNPGGG